MGRVQTNLTRIIGGDDEPTGDHREVYSDRIDLLRARAKVLGGTDRALLELYLEHGSTISRMARLAGINEATVARKIQKLTRRLLDGEYITCLHNRDMFSTLEQAIAKDYLVKGLSQRRIAKKRNVSIYRVRKTLKKIQELVTV